MGKQNTTKLADPANESFAAAAGLSRQAVEEISDALRRLLADVFALYLKTRNFHWHMITFAITISCWTSKESRSSL